MKSKLQSLGLWMVLGLAPVAVASAQPAASGPARSVDLHHFAVDLRFDLASRSAQGLARLTLSPLQATEQVALDAGRLMIDSVTGPGGVALQYDYDGGDADLGLRIRLQRRVEPHERIELQVRYRTTWVNTIDPRNLWGSNGKGLRFLGPSAVEPKRRVQIWASGEPGANRYWMPGSGAPEDLRTSEFSATVPAALQVVAGGTPIGVERHADGTRTWRFRTEVAEPDHRMTFAIGDFADVPQRHGRVALHNRGYPDEVEGVAASVEALPDMLRFFERLTGTTYPHPRYTQVFVQDLPWNTVGTGLAVQTENMVDDMPTHEDFQYLWQGLQAESLAQQWFGGLVPVCRHRDAWLERGLAHHLAGLYTEHRHGRAEFLLWYLRADQASTLGDWAQGQRLAVVDEQTTDLTGFVTGNAPYARGAAVLQMLRQQLGGARWRQVIRHYVKHNAGRPTCTAAFQRSVEAMAGQPLDWFFRQWVYGIGHPVFEVGHEFNAATRRLRLRVKQVQAKLEPADPRQVAHFQGPIGIEVDGRVRRVWLEPQAENVFDWPASRPPRWLHFDHEGQWIKELRHPKTPDEWLAQLRESRDPMAIQSALTELARLHKDAASEPREKIRAALRERIARPAYWRGRFNAIGQLATLLTPAQPEQAAEIDGATRTLMLDIIARERSWLRTAAVRLLGLSNDPQYAPLYRSLLSDRSDRVVNAAATALGRSRSALAYDALAALPRRPSWKNQSLISALNGLQVLGDPRGGVLALAALKDLQAARWTLATPVWDFRLAAANTLAALGRGGDAFELVNGRLQQGLSTGDVTDIFGNLQLLVALADPRSREVLAGLKTRYRDDAIALEALTLQESTLESLLKSR